MCGAPNFIGVSVSGDSAINNAILGNSIFSNGGLGIDLIAAEDGACGITTNHHCDNVTGPNHLQNYPVLTSVISGGGNTNIQGSLDAASNTMFRLEFFDNVMCHSSGNGQGQTFIGSTNVMTDGDCNAPININLPANATATPTATATPSPTGPARVTPTPRRRPTARRRPGL